MRAGIVILALAVLMSVNTTATGGYTARTKQMCWDVKYDERERLADNGDSDAIYCSAVWNAAAYTDETKSQSERRGRRALALKRYEKARQLGYDFSGVAMFGMTFKQLIGDGDNLAGNGGVRPARSNRDGELLGCLGRIGVMCSARCSGEPTCLSACNGGNAYQCRQ